MEDFYFTYQNKIPPAKGTLLISEPYLPDPNFKRTVVLLCDFTDEGAFGFVLNRPADVTLDQIIDINGHDEFRSKIFIGGPVQKDTLHFLHKASDYLDGGTELYDQLFWGGNFEQLAIQIETGVAESKKFRFFVGYSGWGPGQLEKEIEENSWIVSPPISTDILLSTSPDELWKEVLKKMGGRYEMYSKYPTDPRLN